MKPSKCKSFFEIWDDLDAIVGKNGDDKEIVHRFSDCSDHISLSRTINLVSNVVNQMEITSDAHKRILVAARGLKRA